MYENEINLNVMELFENKKLVKICAPMVRYSKLQFRNLVKIYDCDLTFTPMILADSFCQSEKARNNEFKTNLLDTPLVTQFAANTTHDFVGAAYLVSPYCSGVDLNCGCPQRWAKELGLGCSLLKRPDVIYDMIRQCRNRIQKPFTVSVKMRLLSELKETVNICKQLEMCGVSFLSVHARTSRQLTGEINKFALKLIKENCSIPIVANGGILSLENCLELQDETNCDGVMVANAVLTNPTMFTGSCITSLNCVQNWLDICYNSTLTIDSYEKELQNPSLTIPEKPHNLTFQGFHHHLVFMLEKLLNRKQKQIFNNLRTFGEVLNFLENEYDIVPRLYTSEEFYRSIAIDLEYSNRLNVYNELKPNENVYNETEIIYNSEDGEGKFFKNKSESALDDCNECDWSNIFLENG